MRITTKTGSVYDLDTENNTIVRNAGADSQELRRDSEPVKIKRLPYPPTLGDEFIMILDVREDGIDTVRVTTPIVKIELPNGQTFELAEDEDDGND